MVYVCLDKHYWKMLVVDVLSNIFIQHPQILYSHQLNFLSRECVCLGIDSDLGISLSDVRQTTFNLTKSTLDATGKENFSFTNVVIIL